MKFMNRLTTVSLVALLTCGASASALYWMVDTTADDAVYQGTFDHAALFVSESAIQIDNFVEANDAPNGTKTTPLISDLGTYGSSAYSFYVELYDETHKSVYKTSNVSYNDLLASGYITVPGSILPPTVLATSGFNGASVPEPMSGLMVLSGAGAMLLRRRRTL